MGGGGVQKLARVTFEAAGGGGDITTAAAERNTCFDKLQWVLSYRLHSISSCRSLTARQVILNGYDDATEVLGVV